MITRQRTGFDAVAHLWLTFTCIDIGREDDTTVPADQHPAVIEDAIDGPTERLDGGPVSPSDAPLTWTQGEKTELIRRHLQANGTRTANEIAEAIGDKVTTTSNVLKRYSGIFKIVEYRKDGRHKAAVWGLRPEEWKP